MRSSPAASNQLFQIRLTPFGGTSDANLALEWSGTWSRTSSRLEFSFTVTEKESGALSRLDLRTERPDELWKSTCFEIFIGHPKKTSYLELNLSPAGESNVYHFDQMRIGMRPASDARIKAVPSTNTRAAINWQATLESTGKGDVFAMLGEPRLELSVTAVVKLKTGEISYWAAAHKGLKPDFHLRESFILSLNDKDGVK